MNIARHFVVALVVAAIAPTVGFAGDSAYSLLAGKWRITRAVIAPWTDETAAAGGRRVSYEMLRENGHWVIDDLVFERYDRLTDLLGDQ